MKTKEPAQQKLPIDTFMNSEFPFSDVMLRLSAEAVAFLLGTTNGRMNFQYYCYMLAFVTVKQKCETLRGIKVDTVTGQLMISVSSLEQAWGMKRKQGRNFLDRMEQLKLIRRTSDYVTTIIDVTGIAGMHAAGGWYANPSYDNGK